MPPAIATWKCALPGELVMTGPVLTCLPTTALEGCVRVGTFNLILDTNIRLVIVVSTASTPMMTFLKP